MKVAAAQLFKIIIEVFMKYSWQQGYVAAFSH